MNEIKPKAKALRHMGVETKWHGLGDISRGTEIFLMGLEVILFIRRLGGHSVYQEAGQRSFKEAISAPHPLHPPAPGKIKN